MQLSQIAFTAKQLQSIHQDHLGFLLASSHCCNELLSVSPYIIFEQDVEEANEVEKAFIFIRFFTIVRFQVAKIFEYRELCNGYIGKIRKTFPNKSAELSKRSGEIARKIDGAKWAQRLRNKVAFHFDSDYALQCLANTPDSERLYFFAGPINGLTAFDFADRILVNAMFVDAGLGNRDQGRDEVLRWAAELRKLILEFHADTMGEIFQSVGLWQDKQQVEIRDSYCASIDTVRIPLSTPYRSMP